MAAPKTDQQLVLRRVYDDAGQLIREGRVPKDVQNSRQALLDYWAQADAAAAEADAAAAQAEVDRIAAMDQAPSNDVLAIPGLMAAVEQHAGLIETLDQRTQQLEAAQPDEVLRLASQIQLGAGAAQALEATAAAVQAQIQQTADQVQQRLDDLDGRTSDSLSKVADAITFARTQIESNSAQAVADARKQVAQLVTTTTARVADMRGPKGSQGSPGAAIAADAGPPSGPNATMASIGRGAVVGDLYLDGASDDKRVYRWTGDGWEPGFSLASTRLINAQASVLQVNKPAIIGAGGGGSSGPSGPRHEELSVRTLTLSAGGAAAPIWSSLNWAKDAKAKAITSVSLGVELSGSATGLGSGTYYTRIDLSLRGTEVEYSIAPELTLGGAAGAGSPFAEYLRDHLTVSAFQTPAAPPATTAPVLTISLGLDADPAGIASTPLLIRGWVLPAGEQGGLIWTAP